MPNTSATGGYLQPAVSPAPLEGEALDNFVHDLLAGVTGLDNALVRPRWQVEPANLPPLETDWAAFGISKRPSDTFAAIVHSGDLDGSDQLVRTEELDLLVTFYGPGVDYYAALLRDGLSVPQNLETLQNSNFSVVEVGEPIAVPALLKDRWQYRMDLPIVLRRLITRVYPVLNIVEADGTMTVENPAGITVIVEQLKVTE